MYVSFEAGTFTIDVSTIWRLTKLEASYEGLLISSNISTLLYKAINLIFVFLTTLVSIELISL